jgi:DNA-binding CsgD family transcriptional regulator
MLVPQSPRSPRLIGRQSQLKSLEELLQQASKKQGRVALVKGEAGIGKSTVVREMVARAKAHGFRAVEADCVEADSLVPYGPLFDLFETLQRSTPDLMELVGPTAPVLVKWIPIVQLALTGLAPAAPVEPEQERRRFFNALTQFFVDLSAERNLIIVVEDLHWCDDASLDYWLHLARRVRLHPILLVMTLRSNQVPPSLSDFLAELDRERLPTVLALEPLSRGQVDEMLRACFDLLQPVRPEFLDAIYGLTEGNPFFVEEVLGSLIASGEIYFQDGAWNRKAVNELHIPRSISDGVRRSSEQLSRSARAALVLASVIGRRFDFGLLRELSGVSEGEQLRAVRELVQAQLVREESADAFAFRHSLIREAVYATLLVRERKGLHLAIAQALERRGGEPSAQSLRDLAVHYFKAEVWDKTLEYSLRAGQRAQAFYAPSEAAEYYNQAVDAAGQLFASPSPLLLRARGQTYETLGDFDKARTDYETARRAARDVGDLRAEWQSLIDLGFLWTSRDYSLAAEYYHHALEIARSSGDRSLVADSLNRIGNWHLNLERPHEARGYHEEALAIFRELNDTHGVATSLDLGGVASINSGDLVAGKAYCEQAIALFRELDDRVGLVSCLATVTMCAGDWNTVTLVPATDFARATAEAQEATQLAHGIGLRSGEAFALTSLAAALDAAGEYDRALEAAHRALSISTEIGHRQWQIRANVALGMVYLHIFAFGQARHHFRQAEGLASESGSSLWSRVVASSLAFVDTLEDNPAAAAARLDAVLGPQADMRTMGERQCWHARAEIAHREGKEQLALEIVERLIITAPNISATDIIPPLWMLRGKIRASQNDYVQAEADLLTAQTGAARQRSQPILWRIQIALGRVYEARKQHAAAERSFASAGMVVQELAENVAEPELRANFLSRATAKLPHPRAITARQAAKIEFQGLTARERQVAALIALGKTNREIAEALVISEYTVATHVGNILNKLGFSSRTQIAAWAAGMGLEPEAE